MKTYYGIKNYTIVKLGKYKSAQDAYESNEGLEYAASGQSIKLLAELLSERIEDDTFYYYIDGKINVYRIMSKSKDQAIRILNEQGIDFMAIVSFDEAINFIRDSDEIKVTMIDKIKFNFINYVSGLFKK